MTDEEVYRREWAQKTGRAESEVYVPEAIRDECPPGVHSMFDFCPGRDVCQGDDEDEAVAIQAMINDYHNRG